MLFFKERSFVKLFEIYAIVKELSIFEFNDEIEKDQYVNN